MRLLILCLTLSLPALAAPPKITGNWVEVERGAPAGPHVLSRCWEGHDALTFTIERGTVLVSGSRVRYGARPPPWFLNLSGKWKRGVLELTGEEAEGSPVGHPERWILRYDRKMRHLVGTRNGEPFQLARLRFQTGVERCPPPPP